MIKIIKTTLSLLIISTNVGATSANFEIKASFKSNPKIWGTYKLEHERVKISRGKKVWRKSPPSRIGDVILSKGHFVFVRENKTNNQTKIVVDKIPYLKRGKKTFNAQVINHQENLSRLFDEDLRNLIPHKDLLGGNILYHSINCKKRRGHLLCTLSGELNPPESKVN